MYCVQRVGAQRLLQSGDLCKSNIFVFLYMFFSDVYPLPNNSWPLIPFFDGYGAVRWIELSVVIPKSCP